MDTLEYLRRGGRIGAATALFGGALAVKPLLQIKDGRVDRLEKVRTAARAIARIEELAVQAAGAHEIDLCVAHLANPDRAAQLVDHLGERLAEQPRWAARSGAASSARSWVRTSARAPSPSACPPASDPAGSEASRPGEACCRGRRRAGFPDAVSYLLPG